MNSMSLDEFKAAIQAQGVPLLHAAFSCPMCGTVQSASDLIAAGAGADLDAVECYLAFSCVGRFTGAGPALNGKRARHPGGGCDWTLGGLFQLHELEVVTEDGRRHPRFMPVAAEVAQQHMRARVGVPG